jgi:hypothetical protein
MKKIVFFLAALAVILAPRAWSAMTKVAWEEMTKVWVAQHNSKLPPEVQRYMKAIKVGKSSFHHASLHRPKYPMRGMALSVAEKFGIPMEMHRENDTVTPLTALYNAKGAGASFLIADYTDEYDDDVSTSDIYIKIGLHYELLFHGQGYRECARLFKLGKTSPIFFEIGNYGGGSRCDKIFYILNQDAVKNMPNDVYEHHESVKPEDYIQQVLQLNNWIEGYTLYKDVDKDGMAEIVNGTEVEYPADLKAKLKSTFALDDNDMAGLNRKTAAIYKWNGTKFDDMGDYFY